MAETNRLTVRLNAVDNVVTARVDLTPGVEIAGEGVSTSQPIPSGHKVATASIKAGEPIRKYDQIIGFATEDIAAGDHVHVHNVEMQDFERDYAFGVDAKPTAYINDSERATFQGYKRPGGRVGTRNYIGVLTSVNCSATAARYIAEAITL